VTSGSDNLGKVIAAIVVVTLVAGVVLYFALR
jgi:hypothetical protein